MARPANSLPTETVTISTSPGTCEYLEQLVSLHVFGKNRAEAATRLVEAQIHQFLKDGTLKRIRSAQKKVK